MKTRLDQDQVRDPSTTVLSIALGEGGMTNEGMPLGGRRMKIQVPVLVLALLLAAAGLALTNSTIKRPRAVLGGGATDAVSIGGAIAARATLGQPLVGVSSGGEGEIALEHGFWHGKGVTEGGYSVHLPLIVAH